MRARLSNLRLLFAYSRNFGSGIMRVLDASCAPRGGVARVAAHCAYRAARVAAPSRLN